MKEKREILWGIRFSKEEVDLINSLRKGTRLNKSEMIRHLVQEAITAKNKPFPNLTEELEGIRKRLQTLHQMNRYVASLLTALVRKSSKSNPEEAERIILTARAEAEKCDG